MIKSTLFAALLTASALASAANPLYHGQRSSAPYSAPSTGDVTTVMNNPLYEQPAAPSVDEGVVAVNNNAHNPLFRPW